MLRFLQSDRRYGRREVLRLGGGLLGKRGFAQFSQRLNASEKSLQLTGKSVVFLFLHGGPSQIETFDPKMTAPIGNRSATGEIATAHARRDIRQLVSETRRDGRPAGHCPFLRERRRQSRHQTRRRQRHFRGGSRRTLCPRRRREPAGHRHAAELGSVSAISGPQHRRGNHVVGKFDSPGFLGGGYTPFVPGAGGELQQNLQLNVPAPD